MLTVTDNLQTAMMQFSNNLISIHTQISTENMQGKTNFLVSLIKSIIFNKIKFFKFWIFLKGGLSRYQQRACSLQRRIRGLSYFLWKAETIQNKKFIKSCELKLFLLLILYFVFNMYIKFFFSIVFFC